MPLFRLLRGHNVHWTPLTIRRTAFLIQSALWSTLFARVEQVRYGRKMAASDCPPDPIFIIGHWRTGTTYLHQLLNLHPGFHAPTLFEVAIPEGFMVSGGYYKPVMNYLVPSVRPMDNVVLGMNEPQEDEYALLRMTGFSPLCRLIFPEEKEFFLKKIPGFLPQGQQLELWKSKLQIFFKKMTCRTGKTIISKNPFNALRIPLLAELFPGARFIHITRHPEDVIPSSIHMFRIVQQQNIMNRNFHNPITADIIPLLDHFWTTIRNEMDALDPRRTTWIRYEDLVAKPNETVENLLKTFNLPVPPDFGKKLTEYTRNLSGYQTNKYSLPEEDRHQIRKALGHHYQAFGYLQQDSGSNP